MPPRFLGDGAHKLQLFPSTLLFIRLRTNQYSNSLWVFNRWPNASKSYRNALNSYYKTSQRLQRHRDSTPAPAPVPSYIKERKQQQQREQQHEQQHEKHIQKLERKQRAQGKFKDMVLKFIVALNTMVFFAWQYNPLGVAFLSSDIRRWMNFMHENFIVSVDRCKNGYWWTAITAGFSHQNLFHLAVNMFTLHTFGKAAVFCMPNMGTVKFCGLLIGSLLSASGCFLWHRAVNGDPRGSLGASGMVSGLITAVTCAFPKSQVQVFGILPAPMWVSTIAFFAVDSAVLGSGVASPISHDAHVGGAVFGAIFYFLALRQGKIRYPERA